MAVPEIACVLKQAMTEPFKPVVYRALGSIVFFTRLSRHKSIRKALEPAVQPFLSGLDEKDPAIRAQLLGSLREN